MEVFFSGFVSLVVLVHLFFFLKEEVSVMCE